MSPLVKQKIYPDACQENNLNIMMCARVALNAYRLSTDEMNNKFKTDRLLLKQALTQPLNDICEFIGQSWIKIVEENGFTTKVEDGYFNVYKLAL